jgi:hypothetical protein
LFGVLLARTSEDLDVNPIPGLMSAAALDELLAIHWSLVKEDVR